MTCTERLRFLSEPGMPLNEGQFQPEVNFEFGFRVVGGH